MTPVWVAAAWVLGMLAASLVDVPVPLRVLAGVWALVIAVVERTHPHRRGVALLVLVGLMGAWRWEAAQPRVLPGDLAFHNGAGEVRIEGTIATDPVVRGTRQHLTLSAGGIALDGDTVPTTGRVLVTTALYPRYRYGERLRITGELEAPAVLEGFDYREYLASQGILSVMRTNAIEVLDGQGGSALLRGLYTARSRLRASTEQALPHPEAGLLQGILLGLGHTLPPDLAEAFRTAGLTHIIVISGYNVSILLDAWFVASGRLVHRWASLGAGVAVLALFGLLVGTTPPVLRAVITGCLFVAAQLAGRRPWPPASLALAVLAMTAFNPLLLHSVSFQLTIAGTLALVLLQPRFATALDGLARGARAPAWSRAVVEVIVTTVAAQAMALPLLWAHFGEVAWLSLPANALVLPLQPLILVPGAAVAAVGLVLPGVARVLGYALWVPLHATILVVRAVDAIPWARATLPHLPVAGAWLAYGLLWLAAWRLPVRRLPRPTAPRNRVASWARLAVPALVPVLIWCATLSLPDGRLHVYALDVGQGDALLVRTPAGHTVLVDGGPDPLVLASRIGDILPFWERDIDLVVVTHDDADHIGGLVPLAGQYRIGAVVRSGEPATNAGGTALGAGLEAAGLSQRSLARGAVVQLGGCRLTVLHPAGANVHNDAASNDASMVALLEQGGFRMLLTGDVGEAAEWQLLAAGQVTEVTVLKVSHHGAASSSTPAFLEAATPRLAVISAGAGNRFGHPAPGVLSRLEGVGARVLRTDEQGTVEIVSDGARVWVKTER